MGLNPIRVRARYEHCPDLSARYGSSAVRRERGGRFSALTVRATTMVPFYLAMKMTTLNLNTSRNQSPGSYVEFDGFRLTRRYVEYRYFLGPRGPRALRTLDTEGNP